MALAWRTDALRRIATSTRARLEKYTQFSSTVPSDVTLNTPPATLTLPVPAPLTSQLTALGINDMSAGRIAAAMSRVTIRIKDSFEADYQQRCQSPQIRAQCSRDPKLASLLPTTYLTIYTRAIRGWTSHLLHVVTPRVLKAQRSQTPDVKKPFNPSAVPILERFFELNPFPSRLEKFELASDCDMEYRQIHVWFQNRRSRSRKEGRVLTRSRSSSTAISQELENSVADALLPSDDEEAELETDIQRTCSSYLFGDDFPAEGPPHAFPSAYPPICSYDPFPTCPEQRDLQLPWVRHPSSANRCTNVHVDIDDLAGAFDKLHISDEASSTPSSPSLSNLQFRRSHPCFSSPFLTPCSRAPHPALVRRSKRSSRTCSVQWQTRSSPSTSSATERQKCRSDDMWGVTVVATTPRPHAKRTLPRRVPKTLPINPSSTDHRRARPSRSSSPSSDVDTPLSTPPLLTTLLPPAIDRKGADSSLFLINVALSHPHMSPTNCMIPSPGVELLFEL